MALSYTQFIDYLSWRAGQQQIPLSGTFELTSRCNLNCKMCYIHRKEQDQCARRQELSTEEWLGLAKAAQEQGMLLLLLTGGEPFVRNDFWKIYQGCKALGLSVSINTNGTLLTAQNIQKMCEDPPARINLTLYGTSRETYEHLCGNENAFDRVMEVIHELRRQKMPLKLNYSVTSYNQKEFQDACKLATDLEIPIQAATYMFPPVRTSDPSEQIIQRLTPQEAAKAAFFYDQSRFSEAQMRQKCEQIQNLRFQGADIVGEMQNVSKQMEKMSCRAGSTAFWINWKGQMQLCGMMEQPVAAVLPENFAEVWHQMRQEREKIFLPKTCSHCEWRRYCECCPAACYGENRRYDMTPAYLCEKMATYRKLAKKYLHIHPVIPNETKLTLN